MKEKKAQGPSVLSQTKQKRPIILGRNEDNLRNDQSTKTKILELPIMKNPEEPAGNSKCLRDEKKKQTDSISRKEIEVFELYRREFLEKVALNYFFNVHSCVLLW